MSRSGYTLPDSVGQWNRGKTHCPADHEFTEANTYVRTDRKGKQHRECRRCKREQQQARNSK